ncbi:MAG TPA: hypothetical protein VKJ47_23160 [Candidatus Binatia bacterium]|nr:hypothetical protein [Candidatus Binatia bacterium]
MSIYSIADSVYWKTVARKCLERSFQLSENERGFLNSILRQDRELTLKQARWLHAIRDSLAEP